MGDVVWDALQPAVNRVDASAWAQWLGQSEARIAALFVLHLIGLTLLLGGTLVISLRLLGVGVRSGPVFNFTWFGVVANGHEGRFSALQKRVTAAVALLLWFGVGVAGRAIAFF